MPVIITAPNFLIHQSTRMKAKMPMVSQKKGRCVAFQKIGAIYALSTPYRAALMAIAAMCLLVK